MSAQQEYRANPAKLTILTQLREGRGLSLTDMAQLCGLTGKRSREQVGLWESGRTIPNAKRRQKFLFYLLDHLHLRQNPGQFLKVWDILVEQWQWEDLDDEERQRFLHLDVLHNPYRGLAAFTEEDADYFFGREAAVAKLQRTFLPPRSSMAVLAGPSGSGKSSLIRAGLVPALRKEKDSWAIVVARPGAKPLLALAEALVTVVYPAPPYNESFHQQEAEKLARQLEKEPLTLRYSAQSLLRSTKASQFLLVIDQFEELFTAHPDQRLQERFIKILMSIVDDSGLPNTLLLAIRADYLEEAMSSPTLAPRLTEHLHPLPPMTQAELEAAILRPAHALYKRFEEGLLNRILLDVGEAPGKLTLLEFALTELWNHSANESDRLTIAAYEATGRVQGALNKHAEAIFHNLEPPEQEQIQRLLVQLVKPGKQGRATRLPATRMELGETRWALAQKLAAAEARLVVIGKELGQTKQSENGHEYENTITGKPEPKAELIHEALIEEWDRLRNWVHEAHDFRVWQEQVRPLAHQWQGSNRDEDVLLRGSQLAIAEDWLAKRADELSPAEYDFINASRGLRTREAEEQEAIRQRELENARRLAKEAEARRQAETERAAEAEARAREQKKAATRLRRRAMGLTILGGVAIMLTIVATSFGISSNRNANIANTESTRAVANANLAATNEAEAVAAQGAAEAEAIERATAEAIAVAEAERANAAQATAEAEQARAEHEAAIARSRELAARSAQMLGQNYELALLLALEAGQSAPTFEADTAIRQALYYRGRTLRLVTGHDAAVWHIAWDPTGIRFATAGDDGTARIWDAAGGQELLALAGHQSAVWHVAWNASGTHLLTTSDDGTARVWDAADGQELLTLTGHQAAIGFAAWNPDDTRIITVSDDFTARIWDAENGQLQSLLRGHTGQVVHAAWSPDGIQVVTAGWDSTAHLWDVDTGELLAVLADHTFPIRHVAWDPAGTRIVTASNDGSALIWNADTAEVLVRLAGPDLFGAPHEAIWYADWDSEGERVVTASSDSRAEVWDAQTGTRLTTLAGHTNSWVIQATWSPDDTTILTASWDGTARIWDGQTGVELIRLVAHTDGLSQATWHPSGTLVATASWDGTARVWGLSPGSELPVLAGHLFGDLYSVRHVAWDRSGTRLVTASEDDTAIVWRVADGTILSRLEGHEGWVLESTWNRDNTQILTAGADGTARIWNAATGAVNVLLEGHTGPVYHAAWNLDESRIATASADGTARIWDANSGEVLVTLAGHQAEVNALTWEATGTRIATASADGSARVWNAQTGNVLFVLSGHEDTVNIVQWNGEGTLIATASDDGTARIWDSETGEEMAVLAGHTSNVTGIIWHPSGSRLLTHSWDETARIWNAQTGEELLVLSGHTESVTQATWSPDGSRIVTASNDNTARIWDGNSGELLAVLNGHSEGFRFTSIHHAAWSPDGKRVATAASDGTARVYYVAMADLITAVCQHVVRNMSLIEWQSLMGRATPYHKTCSG